MNHNSYLLLIFFLFQVSGTCFSQQVISSAGATATGTGVQLSWTIGEPVVETAFGASAILTQGFHQSRLFVTAIDQLINPELNLSVYPNPVSDLLNLEISGHIAEGIRYMLLGSDGKLLLNRKVDKLPGSINMEPYPSGTYLLKIFHSGKKPLQSFKIIRN